MDIMQIGQLISSVGFPIVCCIILFKQNGKFCDAINTMNIALNDLSTQMKTLTRKLNEIEKNIKEDRL